MDFKLQNDKTREFYKQDFTEIDKILKAVRKSFTDGSEIDLSDIDYKKFFDDNNLPEVTYITLFQAKNTQQMLPLFRCIIFIRKILAKIVLSRVFIRLFWAVK